MHTHTKAWSIRLIRVLKLYAAGQVASLKSHTIRITNTLMLTLITNIIIVKLSLSSLATQQPPTQQIFADLGKGLLVVVLEVGGVDVEVMRERVVRVVGGVGVIRVQRGELP